MLGSLPVDVPTRCSDVETCAVLLVPGRGGVWSLLEDEDVLGWVRRVHGTTRFEGHGAVYTPERVVRHDRIITSAAGVSSGIDMALYLAALLTDDTTAQAVQLYTEYDPQPPFDSGSIAKVSPEVLERAVALGLASREVLERARAHRI